MTLCSIYYLQSCSEFSAGNALRSSQRYHALDETALFGSACRHEFPHTFINLNMGNGMHYVHCVSLKYNVIATNE